MFLPEPLQKIVIVDSEIKLCAKIKNNDSISETINNGCISRKKDLEDKCA